MRRIEIEIRKEKKKRALLFKETNGNEIQFDSTLVETERNP